MLGRLVCVLFLFAGQLAYADDRVRLTLDTSEAEAVLEILDLRAAYKPVLAMAAEPSPINAASRGF